MSKEKIFHGLLKKVLCPIVKEELVHISETIDAKKISFGSRITDKEKEELYHLLKIRKLLDCKD